MTASTQIAELVAGSGADSRAHKSVCLFPAYWSVFSPVKMDCELLISEVFSKKPLWQLSHRQHHNRGVLDKVWDKVANKMNSSRK
jgi:hypothetical protein